VSKLGKLALALGVLALGVGVAGAASDGTCRIEKLRALEKDSACINRADIQAVRQSPLPGELEDQLDQCKADLVAAFQRAENQAQKSGRECPKSDTDALHNQVLTACCPLCGCE
jgi:hypothetical protein